MDPTLAAIVCVLAVLIATGVVARTRQTLRQQGDRHRAMAIERGLGPAEVEQLEHLAGLLPETKLADLLISPIRYNRAISRYLNELRAGSTSSARYFGIVLELTRLRRKVHPPGNLLRFLHSTRELPEGEDVALARAGRSAHHRATIWSVNEDHFELRLADSFGVRGLQGETEIAIELLRPGQGIYRIEAPVRVLESDPRPTLRLEHSERIHIENRREYVRERSGARVAVTPDSDSTPIEAALQDLSGGGLSFSLARPLPQGAGCDISLWLDPTRVGEVIEARAIVLRRDGSRGDWDHHCRWDQLAEEDREAVIRFVFGLQRQRIRSAKQV